MRLPFTLRALGGSIDITVDATRDPEGLGAPRDAQGLAHYPWGYTSPKGAVVSFAMQAVASNPSQILSFTASRRPGHRDHPDQHVLRRRVG